MVVCVCRLWHYDTCWLRLLAACECIYFMVPIRLTPVGIVGGGPVVTAVFDVCAQALLVNSVPFETPCRVAMVRVYDTLACFYLMFVT
jgi:hypothetical protein